MSALVARRYYLRGAEALQRREHDEAMGDFQAALELCPHFYEARVGVALALCRQGESARAANLLRGRLAEATELAERVALSQALAEALIASRDLLGAERALAEAVAGGAAGLHDPLARLRARSGRFSEAFAELLKAAQEPPDARGPVSA